MSLRDDIDLAIQANGGDEWRKDWCSCDPSVGAVPCEYCAIHRGLKKCKEVLEKAEKWDREIREGNKMEVYNNTLVTCCNCGNVYEIKDTQPLNLENGTRICNDCVEGDIT